MNADIEELLREGIDRLTEGAVVTAGLADRARRHIRRQRLVTRATAAGGAALAAAAAVVLATIGTSGIPPRSIINAPGASSIASLPNGVPARTAAYVINRTKRALTAAERGNAVEEIHAAGHYAWWSVQFNNPSVTGSRVPAGSVPPPFNASRLTVWYYQGQLRWQGLAPTGAPVFDASMHVATSPTQHPASTGVAVNYAARTSWSVMTSRIRAYVPYSCSYLPPPQEAEGNWATNIRKALSCGLYRLAGHQWVGGIKAIKIVSVKGDPSYAPETTITETLLIDPSTYLPARVMWSWPVTQLAQTGTGKLTGSLAADFEWLPPTQANLKALHVPIPPGFRHLSTSLSWDFTFILRWGTR
jgi:hypothetical protein